jgi:hypothetical protein
LPSPWVYVGDQTGAAPGLLGRPADAAEGVEVVVEGGDAELDRLEVLVGELDAREHALEQGLLAYGGAGAAVGETLSLGVKLAELALVLPGAAVDQKVDVGAVGPLGVAEDA